VKAADTHFRDTLIYVRSADADRQNVTLSLSKPLLRKAKILAVERQTSLSALLAGALENLVQDRHDYEQAKDRALARMKKGFHLGTNGRITWTRESLHERR
jgi:hypothetical protein